MPKPTEVGCGGPMSASKPPTSSLHPDTPRPSTGQPDPTPVLVHPAKPSGHCVLLRVELVTRGSGVGGDGDEKVPEWAGDGDAGHGGDGTGRG
jgi:hypothetical protein